MEEVIKGKWEDYRVEGKPSTDDAYNEACKPFDTVMHAAHIRPALDIVRDNTIRRHTISDKSHLTNSDIRVVWTSPFLWGSGSRYGCIQWTYDWKSLLKAKNVYWLEIVKYSYPACRFLITDKDYADHEILRKYDPTGKEGPWWYDPKTDRHYHNAKRACVEFMIEEELSLGDAQLTEFVSHSNKYCRLHKHSPSSCWEFGKPASFVGARFIGQLIGSNLDAKRLQLTKTKKEKVVPSESLICAWNDIYNRVWRNEGEYKGLIGLNDPAVPAVARAILAAIGYDNREERKALTFMFHSREEAVEACSCLLQAAFGLTDALPLDYDD